MIIVQVKGLAKEGKSAVAQALAALLTEYGIGVECFDEGVMLRPTETIGALLDGMGKRKAKVIIATKEVEINSARIKCKCK